MNSDWTRCRHSWTAEFIDKVTGWIISPKHPVTAELSTNTNYDRMFELGNFSMCPSATQWQSHRTVELKVSYDDFENNDSAYLLRQFILNYPTAPMICHLDSLFDGCNTPTRYVIPNLFCYSNESHWVDKKPDIIVVETFKWKTYSHDDIRSISIPDSSQRISDGEKILDQFLSTISAVDQFLSTTSVRQ